MSSTEEKGYLLSTWIEIDAVRIHHYWTGHEWHHRVGNAKLYKTKPSQALRIRAARKRKKQMRDTDIHVMAIEEVFRFPDIDG